MGQEQRDRVMSRLRAGTADLLVATDVAARGLDVEQLTHVVNYEVPSAPESYVHRIGRVGRGGREGVAITLAEPREHRMLKTIERATGQRISVQKLPTTADLRARRLELTRAALTESLLEDQLDQFRVVVETLTDDFDVMQVALAAVKLAHEATTGPADEDEIPEPAPAREPRERRDGQVRQGAGDGGARQGGTRSRGGPAEGRTRLFVNLGRSGGVRPQDLVGAITGETRLSGRDIGAIEITDRFSLVEVPDDAAAEVIDALQTSRVKGRRVTVRRDRGR
jgi:ATP-dependent RNA helicase DeaD